MKKHLPLLVLVGLFTAHLHAQDLYLESGASMTIAAGTTVSAKGNVTVANTTGITGEGTLLINGVSAQTISGSAIALPALSLENSAGVRITQNKSLSGPLVLNGTILTVDSGHTLHVNQHNVTRTTGFVNGRLAKTFTPSTLVKTFEVGNDGDYMPVQLTYAAAASNFEASVEAKSNAITNYTSRLSTSKFLDGHYTIFNVNGAPTAYTAQFTFLPAQLQGAAASGSLVAAIDTNTNTWTNTIAQTASTSSSATFNLSNYGRIQLGESGAIVVNLKAFLEGFYAGSGQMAPVLSNSGIGSSLVLTDTLTLELRNATAPYALVSSQKAVLSNTGNGVYTFNNIAVGNYFLVAKHRNHLATWSAAAVACSANTTYDFTTAATQAYGDNMKALSGGVFGLFAGDINQDEFVDGTDYLPTLNNIFFGDYYPSDANGDGFTDGTDYLIVLNNIFQGTVSNSLISSLTKSLKSQKP